MKTLKAKTGVLYSSFAILLAPIVGMARPTISNHGRLRGPDCLSLEINTFGLVA